MRVSGAGGAASRVVVAVSVGLSTVGSVSCGGHRDLNAHRGSDPDRTALTGTGQPLARAALPTGVVRHLAAGRAAPFSLDLAGARALALHGELGRFTTWVIGMRGGAVCDVVQNPQDRRDGGFGTSCAAGPQVRRSGFIDLVRDRGAGYVVLAVAPAAARRISVETASLEPIEQSVRPGVPARIDVRDGALRAVVFKSRDGRVVPGSRVSVPRSLQ